MKIIFKTGGRRRKKTSNILRNNFRKELTKNERIEKSDTAGANGYI